MLHGIERLRVPLQTWSKASERSGNYCWGVDIDAETKELKKTRIYKINGNDIL
ncbi:MAG: hypothetical protein MJZ32_00740 [Bacteroidaceae bacterium]|nr:hypothetical protein [Bacteroidaceae bacterium]